jgi:hypothetical protein
MEVRTMSDWGIAAHGVVSAGFGRPNEITVLFDDRTLTFPMPAAATLADLAGRLAEAGGPPRRVTVKLGAPIGFRGWSRPRETV